MPASTPIGPKPTLGNNVEASPSGFLDLWWLRIPAKIRGYSTLLWAAWSDGIYLTAWPRVATVLIAAMFGVGFIEGVTHWSILGLTGYGVETGFHATSFAQMLPLMVLAVVLGSVSANLGLTLVIGFALGDFFVAGAPFSPWVGARIAQLAAYLVFFFLAAWPTLAGKFLVTSVHRRFRESQVWKTALMLLVQPLFVYEWTYFAPMGVKQQWDCCSETSPLDVRYFTQTTIPWLVGAAVLGVIARGVLIKLAERSRGRLSHLQSAAHPGSSSRMPPWLHAILGAIVMTLLLLGFAVTPERIAFVFVVFAGILLARRYLLPGLPLWRAWTARLVRWPSLVRLAAATVVTYCVCRMILLVPGFGASEGYTVGNFGPELGASLIGYIVLLVLLPDGALSQQAAASVRPSYAPKLPIPSGVIQAGVIIAFVLLATKKALAGACLDTRCCMNGDNGLAAGATAAGIPSAAGTAGAPDPCQAEKDAVQKDEDKILSLQTVIDGEEQMLADLQRQVTNELIALQSMAAAAMAESVTNPLLVSTVGPLASMVMTFNMSDLFVPGASPDQFFSNPSFASLNSMAPGAFAGLGIAQMYPATLNFLMQLQQLLPQLSTAAGIVNMIRDQKLDLLAQQDLLRTDTQALADCEASHGGSKKK